MSAKKRGLLSRLLDKARTRYEGSITPTCWACSMNRCGQMFDNSCTCCRSHPGR